MLKKGGGVEFTSLVFVYCTNYSSGKEKKNSEKAALMPHLVYTLLRGFEESIVQMLVCMYLQYTASGKNVCTGRCFNRG